MASPVIRSADTASRVLAVYRRLLRQASRLPAKDRVTSIQQIKAAFRAGKSETSPEKISELLGDAHKRLGYLRIVTPKLASDEDDGFAAKVKTAGRQRYVVGRGGDLVPLDDVAAAEGGRGATTAGVHNLDPQDVKRHVANLQRFHFGGRPLR